MSVETAGWVPDPSGRFEFRYWDGRGWTDHVSTSGRVGADPTEGWPAPGLLPPPPPPVASVVQPIQTLTTPSVAFAMQPRNNGLAIASMVLGIVWIYGIGSILAVIFGHVALSQIKRSVGSQRGRGMAIAGLVLGYIGVALLALIIVGAAVTGDTTR